MEIKPTSQQLAIEPNYEMNFNLENGTNLEGVPEVAFQGNANPKTAEYGQKPLNTKEIKKSVDKLNKLLEDKETYLQYEVYGKFKDMTIKIINRKTKEVIKEIPPKKIIDMVAKLCELAGVFVDEKA